MAIFKTPKHCKQLLYNAENRYLAMWCNPVDVVFKVNTGEYDISQKDFYSLCRPCEKYITETCVGGLRKLSEGCFKSTKRLKETEYVPKTLPQHLMVLKGLYEPYFYCFAPGQNLDSLSLNTNLLPIMMGNVYTDGSFCTGSGLEDLSNECLFLEKHYLHFLNCTRNNDYNYSYLKISELVKQWLPEFQANNGNFKRIPGLNSFKRVMRINSNSNWRTFEPGTYESALFNNSFNTDLDNPDLIVFHRFLLKRMGD